MTEQDLLKPEFWEKHTLDVVKTDDVEIYRFTIPNRGGHHSVRFANVLGVTAVTGDWGNWVFCRTFDPFQDGKMDIGYMAEKARIATSQTLTSYDAAQTKKEIIEAVFNDMQENGVLMEEDDLADFKTPIDTVNRTMFGHGSSEFNDLTKYYLECYEAADDGEFEYMTVARDIPSGYDNEQIIIGKTFKAWFLAIVGAYNACVDRANAGKYTLTDKTTKKE